MQIRQNGGWEKKHDFANDIGNAQSLIGLKYRKYFSSNKTIQKYAQIRAYACKSPRFEF